VDFFQKHITPGQSSLSSAVRVYFLCACGSHHRTGSGRLLRSKKSLLGGGRGEGGRIPWGDTTGISLGHRLQRVVRRFWSIGKKIQMGGIKPVIPLKTHTRGNPTPRSKKKPPQSDEKAPPELKRLRKVVLEGKAVKTGEKKPTTVSVGEIKGGLLME